jgi:hypothetical protein
MEVGTALFKGRFYFGGMSCFAVSGKYLKPVCYKSLIHSS